MAMFSLTGCRRISSETLRTFRFTGLAPNGYSELDAGVDVGGPIIKNRLTFFAAFNPQYRTNHYLTQTFRDEVEGQFEDSVLFGEVVLDS